MNFENQLEHTLQDTLGGDTKYEEEYYHEQNLEANKTLQVHTDGVIFVLAGDHLQVLSLDNLLTSLAKNVMRRKVK